MVQACIFTSGQISSDHIIYTYDADYPLEIRKGTGNFTDPYQVIVPSRESRGIGKTVILGSNLFEIVGVSDFSWYFISEQAFEQIGGFNSISKIRVYSAGREVDGNDRVESLIKELFPHATIGGANDQRIRDANDSPVILKLIGIQTFLSVVSFTFLLQYILSSLRKENVVCLILGASKARTAVFVFRDAFVLSFGVNVLGLLTHRLLYDPVFRELNLYTHITYSYQDYCMLLFALTMFSVIAAIPVVLKEVLSTPMAAKRRNLC